MLADGGRCVSDLVALGSQPTQFGEVASVSTARRVLLSVGQVELDRLRRACAQARARAWAAGAAPAEVMLDFDATPITAQSDKEGAAGHYKGGLGFNLLLVSCGREVLAVILRPGNAGANNAADHLDLFELALEQLPPRGAGWADPRALGLGRRQPRAGRRVPRNRRPVLLQLRDRQARARCDPGPARSRRPAIDGDNQPRDGTWVAELTDHLALDAWPQGSRLIVRRERPHRGAQTPARDDEQARRARLLLLGKGAVLAHRFDHRLTAGLDESEQSARREAGDPARCCLPRVRASPPAGSARSLGTTRKGPPRAPVTPALPGGMRASAQVLSTRPSLVRGGRRRIASETPAQSRIAVTSAEAVGLVSSWPRGGHAVGRGVR